MKSEDLWQLICANGGASYNPYSGKMNPEYGYMVSRKGLSKTIPCSHLTFHTFILAVTEYLTHEKNKYLYDPANFLGFWMNDGNLVMDISEHIYDRDKAIREGKAREQQCIWDCHNNCEIDTRQIMQMN